MYLQLIVIHGYYNNSLAKQQFKTKLTRAFSRRPALLAAFHSDNTPVVVDGVETTAVTIDRERFDRSIEMLVRALYFHVYNCRLTMHLHVHAPLLLDIGGEQAGEVNVLVNNFCLAVSTHLEPKEPIGENPDVFWFKIDHSEQRNLVSCHMQFYGGFDIFVSANEIQD